MKIMVNKIDAARRQVDTAISLCLDERDPVSVHALAMAGFNILHDLAAAREDIDIHNIITKMIRPGMEGRFWKSFRSLASFLKHADWDPDGILSVDDETNDIVLSFCCEYYRQMGNTATPEMMAFLGLFMLMRRDVMTEGAQRMIIEEWNPRFGDFQQLSRAEQLAFGREMLGNIRAGKLKVPA